LTLESVFECFFSPITSADSRVSAYFVSRRRIVLHYVNFLLQFFVGLLYDFQILYTDVTIFLAWNSWRFENFGQSRIRRSSFLALVALQWRRIHDVTAPLRLKSCGCKI